MVNPVEVEQEEIAMLVVRSTFAAVAALSVIAFTNAAHAQGAGVCNREMDAAKAAVEKDYDQWVAAIGDQPAEIRDAYLRIFKYNKDQAFVTAEHAKDQCTDKYAGPQGIMDAVVAYYTAGLSRALPEKLTHVDVSELMAGKPLGGPNAAIPKMREQVFKAVGAGGNSTPENILRDPWPCITFQRKC